MTTEQIKEAAKLATEAIKARWYVGDFSQFCDDPPDFTDADAAEIQAVIEAEFTKVQQ